MAAEVSGAAVRAKEVSGPATSRVESHERSEIVIDGSSHWIRWWSDLYVYRGALQSLAWRNVRSRYRQAALGLFWALLQPALQVGVFTLLFGILAKIPSADVPYPVFVLVGLLPWNLFSKIVSEGAQSLVVNQHLVSKLFFPRIYLVLAAGASALLDAAVTLGLLLGMMLAFGIAPGWSIMLAVPTLAGIILFSFGFASLLAAVNARWRDVQHALPFMLQVGLFVTPVIYRESFVPERWRWVLSLNPLAGMLEVFRGVILRLPMPEPTVVAISLAVAAGLTALGFWCFARTESTIVDLV